MYKFILYYFFQEVYKELGVYLDILSNVNIKFIFKYTL